MAGGNPKLLFQSNYIKKGTVIELEILLVVPLNHGILRIGEIPTSPDN